MNRPPPLSTSAPPALTLRDRIFGGVGMAAVVLALLFAILGGEGDDGDGAMAGAPPPAIAFLDPPDGAEVGGRITLRFDTGTPLVEGANGWSALGRYHLHAMIGATEVMATPGEIRPLGETRYRWTLPQLPAGEHRIILRWSDSDHRTLSAGGSRPLRVVVR